MGDVTMKDKVVARMEYTGEQVVVCADIPYGVPARERDRMEGLSPDTLILMPGGKDDDPPLRTVEFAAVLVNDAPELIDALEASGVDLAEELCVDDVDSVEALEALPGFLGDGDRIIGLLDRDGWEHLTDDPHCCVCVKVAGDVDPAV